MRTHIASAALAVALISGCAIAPPPVLTLAPQSLPPVDIAHADFANPSLWLCRPGLADDKCKINLDATIIAKDGKTTVEKFKAAADPKVDCFFVYPTVSDDKTWASDWTVDKMEIEDIKLQFARFGSVCRQFAPIYRQTTLTALRIASGGPQPIGERLPAGVGGYNDVLDAWNWYMANENKGRGVILIGHSQGAGVLARLIANEIEGKPAQKQFVSAMLLGSTVLVQPGNDTGGTYKTIPLCRAEGQTGCVISYASFRNTLPPPDTARFAKAAGGNMAACNNPAKHHHALCESPRPHLDEVRPEGRLPLSRNDGDARPRRRPHRRTRRRDHARHRPRPELGSPPHRRRPLHGRPRPHRAQANGGVEVAASGSPLSLKAGDVAAKPTEGADCEAGGSRTQARPFNTATSSHSCFSWALIASVRPRMSCSRSVSSLSWSSMISSSARRFTM
jgi:hypothetical protein